MRHGFDAAGKPTITLHQSWLNTFFNCPELARRIAYEGLDDPGSDATAIGTGMHAGIEHKLHNPEATYDDCYGAAVASFHHEASLPGFRYVQVKSAGTALGYLDTCLTTWWTDVHPIMGSPIAIEWSFKILLYETPEYDVYLGGAVDCVDDNGTMWDWKTAMDAEKYGKRKNWEYQRWSIQPTTYTKAWHEETGEHAAWMFAVCLKGAHPKPAQFVPVSRNAEHWAWLHTQIVPIVDLGMSGLKAWPLRDQHVLCSPKWCPAWDTCKGLQVPNF